MNRVRRLSLLAGALVLALSSRAPAQSLRDQLVGNWTLVSWEQIADNVVQARPFGRAPIGRHIFTADGYFCAIAMSPDRPRFASADVLSATPEEKSAAFGAFISYCGRYETIESEGTLLLHPDVSWFPNWTGTTLQRSVEIDGDRATFRFRPPGAEPGTPEGVFVWKRVK